MALWNVAAHIEQWVAFFVLDGYTEQRRGGLRRWQAQARALWDVDIEALPPLRLHVLDLCICLAKGDPGSERGYADHSFVESFLVFFCLGATVL